MSNKALHGHDDDDDFDYEDEHIERESDKQEYEALAEAEFSHQATSRVEPKVTASTPPVNSTTPLPLVQQQAKVNAVAKVVGFSAKAPALPPNRPSSSVVATPAEKANPRPSPRKVSVLKAASAKPDATPAKGKTVKAVKKKETTTAKVAAPKRSVRGKTSSKVTGRKKSPSGRLKQR